MSEGEHDGSASAEPRPLTIRVAGVAKLANGESLRFTFKRGKLHEEGFVLRWADGLRAFANSCPHWSLPVIRCAKR